MSSIVPDDAPRPRLSHVKKWEGFNGFGFNLHAEKGKAGQFIGKIDAKSPADFAGLKEGDRIVEVNGTNISNENHQQVVQRIKAVPGETKLLVVDKEADEYYKDAKVVVRGDMPNVLVGIAPDRNPADGNNVEVAVLNNVADRTSSHSSHSADTAYTIRSCHLRIRPDFQGYGFNLHAEKNKVGQYIGKVDDGSPAEAAGLRERDRILEVNGESVVNDNHQAAVMKIKSIPNETKLLVVDKEADEYFAEKGLELNGSVSFIKYIDSASGEANGTSHDAPEEYQENGVDTYNHNEYINEDAPSQALVAEVAIASELKDEDSSSKHSTPRGSPVIPRRESSPENSPEPVRRDSSPERRDSSPERRDSSPERRDSPEPVRRDSSPEREDLGDYEKIDQVPVVAAVINNNNEEKRDSSRDSSPERVVERVPEPVVEVSREPEEPKSPVTIAGIEFAASAEDARRRLTGRKKAARASANLSAKEKYDLFQRL